MNNLKRNLIVASLFVSGSMLLTGCNTVKGTVQGASRDIKNVVSTVDQPAPKRRVASHKAHNHTSVAKKKNAEMNHSVAQKTPAKSSVQNNAQQMQQHSSSTMTPSTTNSN